MKRKKIIAISGIAILVLAFITVLFTNMIKNVNDISEKNLDSETLRAMTYTELTDEDKKTASDNVQFSAFFTRDLDSDGYAEKLKGTCNEVDKQDTLYIDLNILTQGYLKNGKITLEAENFTWSTAIVSDKIVDGNYIGTTKSIKLQDEIPCGSQKLFSGIINSKIDNNINNYSSVNSVTLTGIYVDEENNETEINKTIYLTVDWYGITETKVNRFSSDKNQTYDIADVITDNNLILKFKVSVSETVRELLLQKQITEISIPRLNGYSPIDVKIEDKNAKYNYNEDSGILTITRIAETDDIGYLQNTVLADNTDYIEVTYPIEAYREMTEDSIILNIQVVGYNYGYNNNNDEFKNPYESQAQDLMTVTYSKPEGNIWNIYPFVGDRIYDPNSYSYNYKVSKKIAEDMYNGNIYDENITNYPVRWKVVVADYTAINKITLEEQKENDSNVSDAFLNSKNVYESMYNYIKTTGLYFTDATSMLGEEGWIELYDAETGDLLEKFTAENWENYTKTTPYKLEAKSIRIETSAPIANTSLTVTQVKEIDDKLIVDSYEKDDFDILLYIYTYLRGKIYAPEGITYEGGNTEAEINKAKSAEYTMPYSVSKISIEPKEISNQKTEKVDFTISTISRNSYEAKWKDGIFLLELPENLIDVNINSVTVSDANVKISAYEAYEKDGRYYIKIFTENNNESIYDININADVTADSLKPTENQFVTLYSYNKNCDNYYSKIRDICDIDTDGKTDDFVGGSRCTMSIMAPSGLITTEYITDYDEEIDDEQTVAPKVAEIKKSQRSAKINVVVSNNYSSTISDIKILGKIPFEGNTYVINGGSLNSQFTANMKLQIQVPEKLKEVVSVYYSENEKPTKDINEQLNGWKKAEEVTDWSKIKTYLIDFGTYKLPKAEYQEFSYEVEILTEVPYNYETYSHHAVYYNLDTQNGKLAMETEPNKVGIRIAEKYNLEITKNKKGHDNQYVKGATYKVTTRDNDGNEVVQMATTYENGKLNLNDLLIEKEYTLTEVNSPDDYILSEDKIKFKAIISESGKLTINIIEGSFKETPEVITNENGKYLIKAKIEDEAKYTLKINKTDTNGKKLENVRFMLNGKNQEEKIYRTYENGVIVIQGLYPNEEYELTEIKADGYYIENASKLFKVVRNENGALEIQTEDSILKSAKIEEQEDISQATITVNIQNEKIPTYNLQIIKVEENVEEENFENLKKLSEARFRLISEDTQEQKEYVTKENGVIEIENLYKYIDGKYITGNYILQEIEAPKGYSNNAEEIRFKVVNNAQGALEIQIENQENLETIKQVLVEENTIKIVIQDKPLFKLTKIDSDTGKVLANAKFVIFEIDEEGKMVDYAKDINNSYIGKKNESDEYIVTTEKDGTISLPLKGGTYKIVEIEAPKGYKEDSVGEYFKVEDTNKERTDDEKLEEETEITEIIEIDSIEDLVELSNQVNVGKTYEGKKVVLMKDLDFKDENSYDDATSTSYGDLNGDGSIEGIMAELTDTEDGCGFTPIGNSSFPFRGNFDGQEHEIKNLYINIKNQEVGLFAFIHNAIIQDLTVSGNISTENSMQYIGGIVGLSIDSKINNCINKAEIDGGNGPGRVYVGGIVGHTDGSKINNCYNYGNIFVASNDTYIGGIVGTGGEINNCHNKGNIYNVDSILNYFSYVGGIVGRGNNISNSSNEGIISNNLTTEKTVYIGGIVGEGSNITNCKNSTNIISKVNYSSNEIDENDYYTIYIGGIGGEASTIKNSINEGNITNDSNCSNSKGIIKANISAGGISGSGYGIESSFNTANINNNNSIYAKVVIFDASYSGIIGQGSDLKNCYNTGNVNNNNKIEALNTIQRACAYTGGIIGHRASNQKYGVRNCYNVGNLKCENITISNNKNELGCYVGGIFGYSSNVLTENLYYLNTIELIGETINTQGIAKKQEEMQSKEFYNKLNTDGAWIYTSNKYPRLLMGVPADIIESTELTIPNTLKKFKVTTDVAEINGIKGGSISGEDEDPYETIKYGDSNKKQISMKPDPNYEIINISINGEKVKYTVEDDGTYTIPEEYFKNVDEDKHIVVTYETVVKGTIITKIDKDTNEPIPNTKFAIYKITTEKEIIDFAKDKAGNYVGTKNENGIYELVTNEKGKIEVSLEAGNYKAVEIEAANEYILDENEESRTRYFDVGDIIINYIEDLVILSNNVNSGTYYEGKVIQLSRTLDFNDESSYRNPTSTEFGDYNGDSEINGIKEELTKESGSGFKPIGYTGGFKGTFNGNGYEIKNIYINSTSWTGLFGTVTNGKILKLGVVGGKIHGTFPTGGIASSITSGEISDCYNTAEISTTNAPAGGIVGLYANDSVISNCYNSGTVTCEANQVLGGIIGYSANNTTIINCYNNGIINSNGPAAGIIGYDATNTKIANCYNLGTVTGGIAVGIIQSVNASQIINCYNLGNITNKGNAPAVGIVFYIKNSSLVENCYNSGKLQNTGEGDLLLGLAYSISDSSYSNCYYLNTTATKGIYGIDDEEGKVISKTEEDMKLEDFVNILNTNKNAITTEIELENWVYKENSYPTFETTNANVDKANNITITNIKASIVIVHHYLKDLNGNLTEQRVAEDEILKNYIGEQYTTAPKIDLTGLELEKDIEGNYIIPDNAEGIHKENIIEVKYYYEMLPIQLKINHYLSGTDKKLADEKIIPYDSTINFKEDGTYEVRTKGEYTISNNEKYKELLEDYVLVQVKSSVKEETEITDILEFNNDSELKYYYKLKEFKITTDVIEHSEEYKNGVVKENVKGGTITSEDKVAHEYVLKGRASQNEIKIVPDSGYEIVKVVIKDGKEDKVGKVYEFKDKLEDDGSLILKAGEDGIFPNMQSDKHVEVEFRKKTNVIIKHLEEETEKVLYTTEDGKEYEEILGYEGQEFETYRRTIQNYKTSELGITDENKVAIEPNGTMFADEITIIYWYEKVPSGILVKHVEKVVTKTTNEETGKEEITVTGIVLDEEVIPGYAGNTETTKRKNFENYIPAENKEATQGINVGKEENSKTVTMKQDEVVEVVYWYEKEFNITTDVIEHTEKVVNTETGKEETVKVKGGTISGEDQTPYEKVVRSNDSTKEIKIVPDDGYKIKKVLVNGEEIYVEDKIAEDGSLVLDKFTNMQENKHIEVEFEKIPAKVIVKFKDAYTKESILDDKIVEGFVNDKYSETRVDIEGYIPAKPEPENSTGTMTEDVIEITYWYTKQFKITAEVKPHEEEVVNEETGEKETKQVPGGTAIIGENLEKEIVTRGESNTQKIVMTPDAGYRIKQITINDKEIDIEKLTEEKIATIKEAYFTDMQEDKHIVVEYERIPATVKVQYLEEGTEKVLYKTEDGKEYEEIKGFVNDKYNTAPKEIIGYKLVEEKYPSNSKGTMTEDAIVVKYYYRKSLFNMKVEKEIEEILLNGEKVEVTDKNIAKLEIAYNNINEIKLEVSYKIKVTNTEELEGTVVLEEILPEGFEFLVENSDENWKEKDGKYLLQTETIKPKETKEYKVTLRWKQSETNKEQKTNIAKIAKTENVPGYEETTKEDNEDRAILIIKLNKNINNEKEETVNIPKTGQSRLIYILAVVVAGTCIGIIVFRKIKNSKQQK